MNDGICANYKQFSMALKQSNKWNNYLNLICFLNFRKWLDIQIILLIGAFAWGRNPLAVLD